MFSKIFTLMMVLSIFTTSAYANSNAGLKAAFDEMNYSLSVEWDQKDKAFYEAQSAKFKKTLESLKAQGLTNEEFLAFVKIEVKNEKIAKEIETAFNMISLTKMSPADAASYMSQTMKGSYSAGASWNGDASLLIGVGVLLVVLGLAAAAGGYAGGGSGGYSDCYYDYYWDEYVCDYNCGYSYNYCY